MRVSLVLVFGGLACGSAAAQPMTPLAEDNGVVVNLEALPIALPRFKPSPDELRPMSQVRPRPKPTPEMLASEAVAQTVAIAVVPLPRAKPAIEVAVSAPPPVPEAPTPAAPPSRPAAPVTIVSAPTTDTSIGVEIRGVAQDPFASNKPINPIEGFAVLSRVRFSNGKTELPRQARNVLDPVVQRLLTSHERVRLAAFSGKAGDFSSDARRLSLARALAIRTYLVSKGVAVDRVDVLAFGGATDGISDRVDVLVRGI